MDEPPDTADTLKRIEALEKKTSQNRWKIIWLVASLICLLPPIFIVTALTMLDISQEVTTPQGKLSIKSHPLPEELLLKIASGVGAVAIGGLALAGRTDVIEFLLFRKVKDE